MHAGCPHSFQCHQWENTPDKKCFVPPPPFFPIGPFCPFMTPNNLSLYAPSWKPPSSPLLPYSTLPHLLPSLLCPLPPSLLFVFPPLFASAQTAQCEDGAEETQWSGQHLGGPGKGKSKEKILYLKILYLFNYYLKCITYFKAKGKGSFLVMTPQRIITMERFSIFCLCFMTPNQWRLMCK